MDKILHYLKDPRLWELWYIPYYGSCRIKNYGLVGFPTCVLFRSPIFGCT